MCKCLWIVGIILVLRCLSAFAAEPLLQQSDLTYLGAFRVPKGQNPSGCTNCDFTYSGPGALAYYPPHGSPGQESLIFVGYDRGQLLAEISIPTPVNSTNISALNTAIFKQAFADPTQGHRNDVGPSGCSSAGKLGGIAVVGNLVYGTAYEYYDASKCASASHFYTGLTLGTNYHGMYTVGTLNPGYYGGWITPVPTAAWKTMLGGPYLTGNCCLSIISRTSSGPAAFVFDPTKLEAVVKPYQRSAEGLAK